MLRACCRPHGAQELVGGRGSVWRLAGARHADCARALVGVVGAPVCIRAGLVCYALSRLHTGWSVHTYQTEKQRRSQSLSPAEVEAILQVIQRAERLDILEQQRVG